MALIIPPNISSLFLPMHIPDWLREQAASIDELRVKCQLCEFDYDQLLARAKELATNVTVTFNPLTGKNTLHAYSFPEACEKAFQEAQDQRYAEEIQEWKKLRYQRHYANLFILKLFARKVSS
jgi:hypothetical protein